MPSIKYITDMTDQEILALTEDDLKRMVQLKMMEEGIKILVRPEQPKYADVPSKDTVAYQVKIGYSAHELLFADRESAQRVLDAIRSEYKSLRATAYMSGPSYEKKLIEFESEPTMSVEEVRFYSASLYDQAKSTIEGNKKLKENYEKELLAYTENNASAEWIRNEVNDKYDEVCRKYRDFKEMLTRFNEYLKIAEEDNEKATAFFIKAYAPDRETMEYLAERTDGKFDLPELPEQPSE